MDPKPLRARNISASVRMEKRLIFSSSVTEQSNKLRRSTLMSGLEKEKRLLKCLSKQAPTVCQSETQEPLLSLMKSIALSVLLMIVEVWKNRVFRSLQVNQHSLDLFLHRGSFLLSSSSSSALRVSSMERFEAKGVLW